MKRNWTEEEDKYILENTNKLTWKDMSDFLDCSIITVQKRAEKLGFEFEYKEVGRWSQEEVKLLREYSDKYVTKTIAKKLNKSVVAIQHKALKEGIKLHSKTSKWQPWMVNYLKDNYKTKSNRQIAIFLGLSEYQVRKKCEELNIVIENNRWTKEEEQILLDNYDKCHYSELTKIIPGKSKSAILCKARDMKLDIITESNHYKYDRKTAKFIRDNWGKISINEMSRQLGVPRSKIYVYKKRLKLPNTGQHIKWNDETINELKELAPTMSISKLAKHFKTSNIAISSVASKNKIKLNDSKLYWDEKRIEKLKKLAKNHTMQELCNIFGVNYSTLNRIIKRNNIIVKGNNKTQGWQDKEFIELIKLKESKKVLDIPSIMKLVNKTDVAVIKRCKELGIHFIDFERKEWTDEEVNSLIEDAKSLNIIELVIKYNRSSSSISAKLNKLNIKAISLTDHWSTEEMELLLKLINEGKSINYISNELNRTVASIENKVAREKLELTKSNRWSAYEEKVLTELWSEYNVRYISRKLKRSESSIRNKAFAMGLKNQFLHQDAIKIEEISELFNVSRHDVETTWIILGLPYKVENVTKNYSYRYVEIDDLFAFLENNQFLYDGKDFEENMLGLEPEWVKQKRKHDTFYGFEYNRTSLLKKKLLQQKKYYLELEKGKKETKKVLKKGL